jgi:hypothetical protein
MSESANENSVIPYAARGAGENRLSRRAQGTGLRLIGLALMGAAAIYAEGSNTGDPTVFYIAKWTFVGTVIAFVVELVLSFF